MANPVTSAGNALPALTPESRRSELEKQLFQAIRRAEQQYRQVLKAPVPRPNASPPHLGVRVDIRV